MPLVVSLSIVPVLSRESLLACVQMGSKISAMSVKEGKTSTIHLQTRRGTLCACLAWRGMLGFVRVGFSDELAVLAGAVEVVEGPRDAVAHLGHGRPVPSGHGCSAAARSAVLGVQHAVRPHPGV